VDGLFVGRAAWSAARFIELLEVAAVQDCVHV
jgi:triosephosphate isomerase